MFTIKKIIIKYVKNLKPSISFVEVIPNSLALIISNGLVVSRKVYNIEQIHSSTLPRHLLAQTL